MKVGLIARGEDRGLGLLSWEFFRHVHPERTVLIDMGDLSGGFPLHLDRYPDAELAAFDGVELDEAPVRDLLAACDVVYVAETFYDRRLPGWAADAGCVLVLHVMPEFFRWAGEDLPAVRWWAPTPWRLDRLPEGTTLVPVPVADDRFGFSPAPAHDGPLRVLHQVGHRAGQDRAGTTTLLRSLRLVTEPMVVTLSTQDARLPVPTGAAAQVTVDRRVGGSKYYWEPYTGHDVMVMPRRYGGLSLPVQEAMASGLAVVMTDVAPNDWWPTLRVATRQQQDLETPGGWLRLADAPPRAVAAALDALARSPGLLADHQRLSAEWAQAHRWSALLSLYEAELARAAG